MSPSSDETADVGRPRRQEGENDGFPLRNFLALSPRFCRKSRECVLTTLGAISRHEWCWGRAVTGHTTFLPRHVSPKISLHCQKAPRGRRTGASLLNIEKRKWPANGESAIPTCTRKHARTPARDNSSGNRAGVGTPTAYSPAKSPLSGGTESEDRFPFR